MSVTLPKFWSYLYRVGQEKHYSLGPEEEINQTMECRKRIHGYGQAVPPWNIHILSDADIAFYQFRAVSGI